mgnify:CR=1 FL=1
MFGEKNLKPNFFEEKKNREIFFEIFFSDFPKKNSVEIIHKMSTLRMKNFTIISQGVLEIRGGTHTQTNSG